MGKHVKIEAHLLRKGLGTYFYMHGKIRLKTLNKLYTQKYLDT